MSFGLSISTIIAALGGAAKAGAVKGAAGTALAGLGKGAAGTALKGVGTGAVNTIAPKVASSQLGNTSLLGGKITSNPFVMKAPSSPIPSGMDAAGQAAQTGLQGPVSAEFQPGAYSTWDGVGATYDGARLGVPSSPIPGGYDAAGRAALNPTNVGPVEEYGLFGSGGFKPGVYEIGPGDSVISFKPEGMSNLEKMYIMSNLYKNSQQGKQQKTQYPVLSMPSPSMGRAAPQMAQRQPLRTGGFMGAGRKPRLGRRRY